MKSAHTPGPWEAYGVVELTHVGSTSADKTICHASVEIDDDTPANMLLIAAAPELLAALEETLEEAISWYDECRGGEPIAPWIFSARAAIKKARGE